MIQNKTLSLILKNILSRLRVGPISETHANVLATEMFVCYVQIYKGQFIVQVAHF